jgi:hypothetical protein
VIVPKNMVIVVNIIDTTFNVNIKELKKLKSPDMSFSPAFGG